MTVFETEYQKLNQQQRQAVDSIEGPVMVIAGAGTGKTQTIALRIANILQKTQTPPSSILCLTFTETAAQNMRDRLLSVIGPTAYSIRISTFHGFCNDIILSHPEHFIFAPNTQSLDDLEKIEIIQDLIEKLPHLSPLKPWGDHFYYQRDIISCLQTLKRENITIEKLISLIDDVQYFLDQSKNIYPELKALRVSKNLGREVEFLSEKLLQIPNLSFSLKSLLEYHLNLYHTGGYDVGAAKSPTVNFKNGLLRLIENFTRDVEKQRSLAEIYRGYQDALKNRGRYDYDDMILFVLHAFQDHPELLSEYQERFLYILADEYQDTNSSQNEILDSLGSLQENPNLFVVGDDDQSIFRFQGAAIENIYNFYQKYRPQIIVLKNNYRSHQLILDSSNSVINRNQNRLASYIKDVDKSLVSVKTSDPDPINLFAAPSPSQENYFIASTIQKLIAAGTSPSQIAVLYRNNNDVTDLVSLFRQHNLKFYLPQDQDVLQNPCIISLIKLFELIIEPDKGENIYPILASDFVNLNAFDLLKISHASASQNIPFFELIADNDRLVSLKLTDNTLIKLRNFHRRLSVSRKWLHNLSLDRFFNKVIRRFKILHFCLQDGNDEILRHLLTLYSELKRLSSEEGYDLSKFLYRLGKYSQNQLPLSSPSLDFQDDSAIKLMTVHRAKGLEFEHVFLYKVVDRKWGNNRDLSQIHLPPGILKYEISRQANDPNEEERRLFYVALTRAKSQIYLSYSATSDTGRPQLPSQFISEIDPTKVQAVSVPADFSTEALVSIFTLEEKEYPSGYRQYLEDYLHHHYKFNVTHLNSYLRCPYCFYHRTILRLPAVRDKMSSYGTAVHHALSLLYQGKSTLPEVLADYQKVLSLQGLSSNDYQESLVRGNETLTQYYNHYQSNFPQKVITDFDFNPDNVFLDNIALTGKIDLVEVVKGDEVNVIDFKTGNPDSKYPELSEDGEYFRQLVFYKLLSALDPHFKYQIQKGIIDFIQPSKHKKIFVRKEYEITEEHLEKLKQEIKEVYQKILNLDFQHIGDNCPDPMGIHYLFGSKA